MESLRLFTLKLASGATRTVVAPSLADVAVLRFDGNPDAGLPPKDDEIVDVHAGGIVDAVLLRDPGARAQAPEPATADTEPMTSPSRCLYCLQQLTLDGNGGYLRCPCRAGRDLAAEADAHLGIGIIKRG